MIIHNKFVQNMLQLAPPTWSATKQTSLTLRPRHPQLRQNLESGNRRSPHFGHASPCTSNHASYSHMGSLPAWHQKHPKNSNQRSRDSGLPTCTLKFEKESRIAHCLPYSSYAPAAIQRHHSTSVSQETN